MKMQDIFKMSQHTSPMKSLIYFKPTKRLQFQSNTPKTKTGNVLRTSAVSIASEITNFQVPTDPYKLWRNYFSEVHFPVHS